VSADDPFDTAALTAGLAAGEPAAVEAFYRAWFARLYEWARRATGRDEAFCLDVVQEAVLRVVRTVRSVDSPARFAAWLKLVVRTTAYDALKKERRGRGAAARWAPTAPPGDPADAVADDERLAWLKRELDAADADLARLIELRYRDGWTLDRIARAAGLTTGGVDGRLRRALAVLRERAAEAFGG